MTINPGAELAAAPAGGSRLRSGMRRFEDALTGPATTSATAATDWLRGVEQQLAELRTVFGRHVQVSQAPDSFVADVTAASPHLAAAAAWLHRDHDRIVRAMDRLELALAGTADVATVVVVVRSQAADLLHALERHRRRGADLAWQAFDQDLGGER